MTEFENVCSICERLYAIETGTSPAGGGSTPEELRDSLRRAYRRIERHLAHTGSKGLQGRTTDIQAMIYASRELPYDGLYSWIDYTEAAVEAFISGHPELKDRTSGIRETAEFRNTATLIESFFDEVNDESGDYASWREMVGRN